MNLHHRFQRRPDPGAPRPPRDRFAVPPAPVERPRTPPGTFLPRIPADPFHQDPDRLTRRETEYL